MKKKKRQLPTKIRYQVFSGIIKNKHELKTLMKWLGINK